MKRTLLMMMLVIATTAFAQTKSAVKPMLNHSIISEMQKIVPSPLSPTGDSRELVPLNDSIKDWQWNTDTGMWMLVSRTTDMMYDENNNLLSATIQSWDGSTWQNTAQSTISYPDNVTVITILKMWDGNAWVNFIQYISENDLGTNTVTTTTQMWSGTAWVNQARWITMSDENQNVMSEVSQTWSGTAWMNIMQYLYTYDGNQNLTSRLQQQWSNNAWENSQLTTSTYSPNNNLAGTTDRLWQNNAWVNATRDTLYTYDGNNNNLSFTSMVWMETDWMNSMRTSYTYDTHNNPTSQITENWAGDNWMILTHLAYAYSYDVNGFIEGQSQKDINVLNSQITSGDSTHYYFHTVIISAGNLAFDENISIYPNPSNGLFTVSIKSINSTSDIKSVSVFTLSGKMIYNDRNSTLTSRQIDLTTTPKGIYILKVETGTGQSLGKLIIQ